MLTFFEFSEQCFFNTYHAGVPEKFVAKLFYIQKCFT